MKNPSSIIAWFALALGAIAWVAVYLFAARINSDAAAYVTRVQDSQRTVTANGSSARVHALAQDTALDREQLDHLLTVDVVSTATLLQGVGKITGAQVRLSGATQEPLMSVGSAKLQPVGFLLQVDGSFASLMRTLQLLATLPLASSIERIDLGVGKTEGKGPVPWHLELYVRVLSNSTTGL